ncbi:acyl-CoA thioesterase [Anaerobacillus sp. MEB173]|uniref:acyl-CoA thioesterase n=1 Tax=Anaerobacillus sp. MEB173 TaxID=3383345 RepID=UPI003F8DE58E
MLISTSEIKVRYAETDQMGVVYHANYLVWFEIGRTEIIEHLGFSYAEMERDGILSPVTDIQASYKSPARYGDTIIIKTWIEHYDGFRIVYGYEVGKQDGTVCVTGLSSHICVKKETFRPIRIEKKYPDWHAAYEGAKKKSE